MRRVLMDVLYFLIMPVTALLVRLTGDPLALKRTTPKGWRPRPIERRSAHDVARHQF